jgi:hypothetical protein
MKAKAAPKPSKRSVRAIASRPGTSRHDGSAASARARASPESLCTILVLPSRPAR